ncbi:Rrf2 family transcriptional regulator [Sediminibacillus massiliensis]|uniref:Rrf2 family transcriptional regulator n=1 Tax=Sediminibacillus massiliensis TaxID=1926277 RepID=UPI0015C2DC95|nr:Rrf2 family transcriptional regulator [Sediminibacillus massiliensis]
MKIKSGVEQAAGILAMLATQEKDIPVKSDVVSERLRVSPTYLKKVMRKLVVNGLITSVSGNQGGFTLAKLPSEITAKDLFLAIEGEQHFYEATGLMETVFPESEVAGKGEAILSNVFYEAQLTYLNTLKSVTVEDILFETTGTKNFSLINWNEKPTKKHIQAIHHIIASEDGRL